MISELAKNFCKLKKEFAKIYDRHSHIQEIIPNYSTSFIKINENHLEKLHDFAKNNPIYCDYYSQKILEVDCTVYEGDINQYWINSLKHDGSAQPFYPTWIFSAYLAVLMAKSFQLQEIVDIGSGDGRIAFCGQIVGMKTFAIEIDEFLADLQQKIIKNTNVDFNGYCANAVDFNYSEFNLMSPAIFTGGLPQMGDILAEKIIEKIFELPNMKRKCCFVLAGSYSKKQFATNLQHGGWKRVLDKFKLRVIDTLTLPTVWTFDQETETPYIYSVFDDSVMNSK